MKSNTGYLKSAGIGSLPPVEEVEHIYDELPYEETNSKKSMSAEKRKTTIMSMSIRILS